MKTTLVVGWATAEEPGDHDAVEVGLSHDRAGIGRWPAPEDSRVTRGGPCANAKGVDFFQNVPDPPGNFLCKPGYLK